MRNKILKLFGVGCTLVVATVLVTTTLRPQTSSHHTAFIANQIYTILSGGAPVKTVSRMSGQKAPAYNMRQGRLSFAALIATVLGH
jgi:hypothetical protein